LQQDWPEFCNQPKATMRFFMPIVLLASVATAAEANSHPCAADAVIRAGQLLHLHWDQADSKLTKLPGVVDDTGETTAWSLDPSATLLPPVKALKGTELLDVLEVNGHVDKITYRMHLLYAQIPDACVFMGHEIIEVADPD
jgi:hypothetical protein